MMFLKYLLPVLTSLSVTQAIVDATFSYEEDCKNLLKSGGPYHINDDTCITDVANAKSLEFSWTQKHRTICLWNYESDDCKGIPVKEQFEWDPATTTCRNIDVTGTIAYNSHKFKLNGC